MVRVGGPGGWTSHPVAKGLLGLAALALTPMAKAAPPADLDALVDALRASPPRLTILLRQMPKGGDLHNHLGGNIYAEEYLRWAGEKDGCLVVATMTLAPPPCPAAAAPVKDLAARDPALYARAIDGLSMRGTDTAAMPLVGHDRFFASFARFGFGARGRAGAMLAIAQAQAADDRVSYVELLVVPAATWPFAALAEGTPWREADPDARLAAMRPALAAAVRQARTDTDAMEAEARTANGCATPAAAPACAVTNRYMVSAIRDRAPASVFAQLALGFALAAVDPRFVGVNIVAPEDGPVALADYALHMRLLRFFAGHYPAVKLSLHAGELAPGLVPPRDLRSHIRNAVMIAGARRIGHGSDIAQENDAPALLAHMARDHVAVEIALTSSDLILGLKGRDHPLALYRRAGVPVVLATDDQGVARSDLTADYVRAVLEQGLRYSDLRQIARDSLTFSFLPGTSIRSADGRHAIGPCLPGAAPDPACAALLATSPKAREQWRLEEQLAAFERQLPAITHP